ncbi:helix-turn-helix domain-containing protein (plasmid) [Burkholderia vietnamiensis]|nr:helix-turn-helix domain-containing protein [Burkholderia vietnamiensis]
MKNLKIVGAASAPATLPTKVRTTFPGTQDASVLTQEVPHDDLAAIMAELSESDPAFSDLLAEAGRDLAPLATTSSGRVTMTSLRMQAGLTQAQLAQKVGQKQANISLYESGLRTDMKRETMRVFCAALGCDMNTLDEALENCATMRQEHVDAQEAAQLDGAGTMKDSA